ncbi:MAG TPA: hypothetical protein VKJ01_26175, partial [Candidatus Solibacter sp.]|nr:hypothetical protein [Candidatus Solibacter sp.]
MRGFPVQTGLSIAMVALLLAVAQRFTPVAGPVEAVPTPPVVRPQAALPAALMDDSNHGLDHFLEALWRTESRSQPATQSATPSATRGAVTRIVHYGDSPTTADLITGDVRSLLQKRFGDA